MQVNYLLGVWLSGSEEESKSVRDKLDEKIDSYAAGRLGHAADVILSIWGISNQGQTPFGPPPRESMTFLERLELTMRFTSCNMRHLLIKSIKEGYLLDRKHWARRSREGAIEPIYFGTLAQVDLDTCESPHPRGY